MGIRIVRVLEMFDEVTQIDYSRYVINKTRAAEVSHYDMLDFLHVSLMFVVTTVM